MEGLIPFVYRAIKRKKSRLYYKCLSSGAAPSTKAEFNANGHMFIMTPPPDHHKYNISSGTAGFEMTEFNTRVHGFMTPPPEKLERKEMTVCSMK